MNTVNSMPEAVLLTYAEHQLSKCHRRGRIVDTTETDFQASLAPEEERSLKPIFTATTSNVATDSTALRGTIRSNSPILRGGYSAIQVSSNWILAHGTLLYPLMKHANHGSEFISDLKPGKLHSVPRYFFNDLPLFAYRETTGPSNVNHLPRDVGESNQVKIAALWKCPLLTETLDDFFGTQQLEAPGQLDLNLLPVIVVLQRFDNTDDAEGATLVDKRLTFGRVFDRQENIGRDDAACDPDDHNKYQVLRIGRRSRPRSGSGSGSKMLTALKQLAECTKRKPARGCTVEIISTPFGNPIFLGTLTRGVIGKVFGRKDCLLVTDANAFPGSEGGPLYLLEPDGGKTICGMVIATTWICRGERTDYTFAANLPTLLEQILQEDNPSQSGLPPALLSRTCLDNSEGILDQSLGVVRCGQRWGTAILMDKRTGTFLTCAHVVTEAPELEIRITSYQGNRERSSFARLIYRTAYNEPYDVAVLSVDPSDLDPLLRSIRLAGRRARKGEDVLAAGYPFSWSSGATFSSGLVSKSLDCMLQTSCCVQSGISGGAIVTRGNHQMLGMVVCNAIASGGTALYPRLSMAIPMTALQQPLLRYCQTSDPTILQAFSERDVLIRKIWKLHPVLLPSNI